MIFLRQLAETAPNGFDLHEPPGNASILPAGTKRHNMK